MEPWILFLTLAAVSAVVGLVMTRVNRSSSARTKAPAVYTGPVGMPSHLNNQRQPPDTFDAQRISSDLQWYRDQPTLFRKYMATLESRFTKAGERALINQWIEYYTAGRNLVEAKTELERATSTYKQLGYEDEIKKKSKDVELAKLAADEAEHNLRAEEARYKTQNIPQSSSAGAPLAHSTEPADTEDGKKMKEALNKRANDIRWKIEKDGEGVRTLVEWQKWRKRQNQVINDDKTLSPTERTEAMQHVNDIYDGAMRRMKEDTNIFEEQ